MAGERPGVYLKGLAELRRTLRKIDARAAKGLTGVIRRLGKVVRGRAKEEARRFRDSGTLEASIRYSVTAKKASVYSNLIYAPVHEYGGTVAPRGAPIHVPRRMFLTHAVQKSRRQIDSELEGLLDELADLWGAL